MLLLVVVRLALSMVAPMGAARRPGAVRLELTAIPLWADKVAAVVGPIMVAPAALAAMAGDAAVAAGPAAAARQPAEMVARAAPDACMYSLGERNK
jgi:hypothetical protein